MKARGIVVEDGHCFFPAVHLRLEPRDGSNPRPTTDWPATRRHLAHRCCGPRQGGLQVNAAMDEESEVRTFCRNTSSGEVALRAATQEAPSSANLLR